ncbi:MAG: hypothetical protein HZB38_02165 [Planctomycetes bacterium]|nr:hypothetical protein [Planctomycetota bacterium]
MVNRVRLVALAVAIAATIHAEHPSLLVTKNDLPHMRHACGVGPSLDDPTVGAFGARRGDFQAVRLHVSTQLTAMRLDLPADGQGAPSGWLPGELVAAAFLHLVEPDDPGDTKRILAIEDALHATNVQGEELIERIIALDWCWSAIEPAARREFLMAVRSSLKPLSPADSPLDHGIFRDRLAGLAAAAAFDADDELGEWWNELRASLLGGARPWVESTLPTYLQWRGGAPTSPESGPQEECDAALAVEFASRLVDDAWTRHHEAIGRSLEHYLAVGSPGEAGGADFVRDVPGEGALSTAPQWKSLLPLTAHLIAARSRGSAAALIADAVERGMNDKTDLLRHAWRWIPIIFDVRDIPRADPTRQQTLRNLGGAVVLCGEGRTPTTIWIDAGQPFLQARQHFDAGGFLIRRGADLAVSAADDLGQYAVQSRKGTARLGELRDAFDFAQFNSATIAHNAMLYTEPNRITRWYGKIYPPAGGQIPHEGTCLDFRRSLDEQGRATGRLIGADPADGGRPAPSRRSTNRGQGGECGRVGG